MQLYERILYRTNIFFARRFKRYIFRLRGIFIKLGQFLGVLSNLFWPEVAAELEELQDHVPSVPYEVIKERFIRDFNKSPHELFQQFDKTPLASASLGQVHLAVTPDGRKVAVKALYPGMERLVNKDLKSIRAILSLFHFFFPFFEVNLIYGEFSDMIINEIDYYKEKENIDFIKANFSGDEDYVFPVVVEEFSSKKVLTTEFIDGIKINNIKQLKSEGIDSRQVADMLVKAYCKMFFVDKKFHADPHPGNIFVINGNGRLQLGFIDFGSVEVFTDRFKRNVPRLIKAIVNKRIPYILEAFDEMGFVARDADRDDIESLIAFRYEKLENIKISDYTHLNIRELTDIYDYRKLNLNLREVMKYYQIPRNYMYFGRTISLLSGLAARLDPKVNIFQIAWPYLEEFVAGKDKTFIDYVKSDAREWTSNLISLPEFSLKTFETINQGKFQITIKGLNKNAKLMVHLGHQFIYTLMLITSGTFSLVLYLNQELQYSNYFLYSSIFFGFLLIGSLFKNRKLRL